MSHRAMVLTSELAERIEQSVPVGKLRNHGGIEPARFGRTIALRGATPERHWLDGVYCFGDEEVPRMAEILSFYRDAGHAKPPFYLAPTHFSQRVADALRATGF